MAHRAITFYCTPDIPYLSPLSLCPCVVPGRHRDHRCAHGRAWTVTRDIHSTINGATGERVKLSERADALPLFPNGPRRVYTKGRTTNKRAKARKILDALLALPSYAQFSAIDEPDAIGVTWYVGCQRCGQRLLGIYEAMSQHSLRPCR